MFLVLAVMYTQGEDYSLRPKGSQFLTLSRISFLSVKSYCWKTNKPLLFACSSAAGWSSRSAQLKDSPTIALYFQFEAKILNDMGYFQQS